MEIQEKADKQVGQETKQAENRQLSKYEREGEIKLQLGRVQIGMQLKCRLMYRDNTPLSGACNHQLSAKILNFRGRCGGMYCYGRAVSASGLAQAHS